MSDSKIIIAPSILSADFGHLQEEIDSIEKYADWLQVDVMDGHFVPSVSFGAPVVKWIKTKLPLDIHLMVTNPADRVQEFLDLGVKHITFHAEAVADKGLQHTLVQSIRSGGVTAGIAINPKTLLSTVDDVLRNIDLLLVMSVDPGFSGQDFILDVLTKVREAREKHPDLMIQMDGGIDSKTGGSCIEAGANNLVSGSYIFGSKDRAAAIASLRG